MNLQLKPTIPIIKFCVIRSVNGENKITNNENSLIIIIIVISRIV